MCGFCNVWVCGNMCTCMYLYVLVCTCMYSVFRVVSFVYVYSYPPSLNSITVSK